MFKFKILSARIPFLIFSLLFLLQSIKPCPLYAESKITLLLTSNLQGRFLIEKENQEQKDPMLILARSILKEKGRYDLYLDMGNSFYPGPLSRYSYGSVMMDFFNLLNCDATLISSRDISIGLSNLEFISRGKKTQMLSANIIRDNSPVFTPYFTKIFSGKKIGIIGVSSAEGLFDIADKKLLNIKFSEYRDSISETSRTLKNEGCGHIILLSGLSYRNNLDLMKDIPEVSLIISGGDSTGSLFSVPVSRLDMEHGRSIITLIQNRGYYRLELDLTEEINIRSMNFVEPADIRTTDAVYPEFTRRLSLWKDKFKEEENQLLAENIPPSDISDKAAADMLRFRYRSEVGIVEKNSLLNMSISGNIYSSNLMMMVNNDYPVFTYSLTGADLKKIAENSEGMEIAGLNSNRVQGYTLSDQRRYTIASTQYAYDRISKILRRQIEYSNTWRTIQDEIRDDLKADQSLLKDHSELLESRFRMLADISLSNFYDRSGVKKGSNITAPPGKPLKSYRRWGMEDTLNLTVYNNSHHFILTPYLYFIKQDELYLQNLFRTTFLYTYNPNNTFRPYHKSQYDTVLVKVAGRPAQIRETAGISVNTERITGRIGAGFEKQIQDPKGRSLYGIETLLDANYPFSEELKYTLKLDSFVSLKEAKSDEIKTRVEVTNSLTYNINKTLGVSVKHKWFYLYSGDIDEKYKYTQMLFSLDLKTDFKLF